MSAMYGNYGKSKSRRVRSSGKFGVRSQSLDLDQYLTQSRRDAEGNRRARVCLWTLNLELWTLDFGLWTLDFGR